MYARNRDQLPPESDATSGPSVTVTRVRIELPTVTIVKVVVALAIIWFVVQIRHILLLVFLGLLIALVFDRPTAWLQRRGLRRGGAVTAVLGAAIGLVALLLLLLVPRVAADLSAFWQQLPTYVDQALGWLKSSEPGLYDRTVAWADRQQQGLNVGSLDFRGLLGQGVGLVSGIGNIIIVLIIAVYLLVDQGHSLDGVMRRLSPAWSTKIRRTIPAVAKVMNGYVMGQTINSTLFALFALAVLSVLGVPSAVVLALIAAIGDAIPQVGVVLATIPALLLALTQSFQTAVIVLIAYVVYQQVENYITSPRVFSKTLDLSPVVTLVAVLIGGKVLGIIGVLLALPVAAAIPVIWRIWLEDDAEASQPDPVLSCKAGDR